MNKASVRANRLEVDPVCFQKRRVENLTDEELTMVQNRLNHHPWKQQGFKTPQEVFHASLNRVAPRT